MPWARARAKAKDLGHHRRGYAHVYEHCHGCRINQQSDATGTGTALGQVSAEEGIGSMDMGMGKNEKKCMDGCQGQG